MAENKSTTIESNIPDQDSPLPDDPAVLKNIVRELLAAYHKEQELSAHLQHQLEVHLRQRFGRKSETIDWENGLFSKEVIEAILAEATAEKEEATTQEVTAHKRKVNDTKGHGRQELPEHLPRKREEIDLPEEEKICSVCNTPKVRIREELSEQLEYIPASLFVKQIVRPVYACPKKHEVSTAPRISSPIEKGLAGPGLLAQIAVSKYGDHLPLNRQEDILSRHGVNIPRSTQCGWMQQIATLLAPLHEHLQSAVIASKVIHTDDTPIEVQEKKKTRKSRVWVYEDPIRQLAVFDYTPNRNRDGPKKFLEGFSGYLQADAYAGYDCIYANRDVTEVACWAHTRRKFYDARSVQPESALPVVAMIKRLYDVERQATDYRDALDLEIPEKDRRKLFVQKRYELRQEHSTKILPQIESWLEGQADKVLPKSPVGKAIAYARSNWEALKVYVTNGDLSIDNNLAERAMRHAVVGRKNWLFFGSDTGGQTWAVLTSLLYSAKRHKLNLFAYMRDVLERIADTRLSELEQFLPDIWKREHCETVAIDDEK